MRRRIRDSTPAFYLLADFLAVVAAYYGTLLIRFQSAWGDRLFTFLNRALGVRDSAEVGDALELFYAVSAPRLIVILALTLVVFYALRDLYAGWRFIGRRPVAWNIVVANVLALILFYAYFYLRRNVYHPRSFFATVLALNVCFAIGFRALADAALHAARARWPRLRCRALLVGGGDAAAFLEHYVGAVRPHGIEIAARLAPSAGEAFDALLGRVEAAARACDADLVMAAEQAFTVAEIMRFLEMADRLDVPVKVLSDKLDVILHRARIAVDVIRGLPLVHFEAPSVSNRFDRLRQHVSFALALVAMVLSLPLLAAIAAAVALTSRGGAYFMQERIGVNHKPFRMLKFRTMWHRADEMQAEVEELNESGAGLFKIRRDPRITPVGRFLRRFSLDELPQFLNVIRGEMLIVGPRPLPRRDFENYYEEWHYSRHSGMPGLTCLWQVSGRSEIAFHDMCILDVYYLRNKSWALDLKIVLRTVLAVLFARGAY